MTDNRTSSKHYFSSDRAGSQKLCSQAKVVRGTEGDHRDAEKLLLSALERRPACMLAYQMLSELYLSMSNDQAASSCRRGVLPEVALQQIIQHSDDDSIESDREGVERQLVYAAEFHSLSAPGVLPRRADMPDLFAVESIKSQACFVDHIVNGSLWHDAQHTMVFDANQKQVTEHTMADVGLIHTLKETHKAYHFNARVFLLGARGAHNFYHWMLDIAPKLGVLLEAGYKFLPTDRFIVSNASSGFARQLIEQFGVNYDQIYATENEFAFVSADELVVPLLKNKMGLSMGSFVPQIMCKQFLDNTGETHKEASENRRSKNKKRLFICRDSKSADGRTINNQQGLFDLLQTYGFEMVNPEDLPVKQQAILFSESDVIVAAHGAALSNILFCDAGTTVIEFYTGHIAPCYWAISTLCDLNYHAHYCAQEHTAVQDSAAKSDRNAARSGNITVPLPEMQALLEQAGVSR